jgi:hypothetical protein
VVPEAAGHLAQQFVAGAVPVRVVDLLKAVYVDICDDEVLARSPRARDFALELLEPDAAPAGAGQLVGPGEFAVLLGFLAVARAELAVTRRALATLKPARTELLERSLVGDVRIAVALDCQLVAFLCRPVALDRRFVAKVPDGKPPLRGPSADGAGARVGSRVNASLATPIGGRLVIV